MSTTRFEDEPDDRNEVQRAEGGPLNRMCLIFSGEMGGMDGRMVQSGGRL